ncbi:Spc24-domain-containing protein [Patellaria atrata CBS 101060]|uniref:Kinetochore protein Spc24 n=1 Tax=Patellaria atrata CBS 101060 TaxID=1346257 RepID=A0A9P4S774_9PEZI|nr:Spc24-domain-containing protein [Patellaria atrata CBS 101060]
MLLDEDPAALISSCASNFRPQPDLSSLTRISTSLSTLSQFRTQISTHHTQTLQSLKRRAQQLEHQHQITLSSHNPTEHASEILRLDTEKFRIAKQASETEIESERLQGELEGLRGVLGREHEGENTAVAAEGLRNNKDVNEDEILLKLKVYRCLGIDVEADPATGEYNKAVIRNANRGDVHVVNIDPKFSRWFYANYFWGTM